uniref:FAD:protein FMN transferase n=1 Tax=Eubacterium cellulosolvens TaxID=29322 RepID=UPI00138B028E|nr:FAD:protein FMN transferase [[Eubacterium] cellulosolvens]
MKKTRRGWRAPLVALMLSLGLAASGCAGNVANTQSTSGPDVQGRDGTDVQAAGAERSGTFFDTVIGIRINDERAEELLDGCFELCEEMESTLSAQKEGSELYRLNHRSEQAVEVSEPLADCIRRGLEFCELSEGAFDITILPVRELWDFETEDHVSAVPKEEEIKRELERVDYRKVHIDGQTVTFDAADTMIDLGGIAKGYISERLRKYLKGEGCTSAMINLGGNVSALGTKPGGKSWVVGIQKPFSDRGEILTTVEAEDQAVISSGIYERYFRANGQFYHHILDPKTGYPAETDLNQVTIIGGDDTACDALATIGIVLGREKMKELTDRLEMPVEILFTGQNNELEWYPTK